MIPGYSWESSPAYFRNNPFITFDDFIISPSKQVQMNQTEVEQELD